jgi:LemA protein
MIPLLIIVGILIIVGTVVWTIYNKLVRAKNVVNEGFSGIDIQLKKRFELIPNLIEAVKGYNAHEAEVLSRIVESRSGGGNLNEVASQDASITQSLKNFRIQVEAYPELKANSQFLKLMDNLSEVENELAMARRYYNGATRDYNTKIEVFPAVMVAKPFGFNKIAFYELADQKEGEAPVVELNN